MIRYFRKLRLGLLLNKNFKNYAFYALGEILLVMIGILLALQVSNWNDENKKQKQVREYLSELKDEMQDNLKLLNNQIDQNTKNMHGAREIIELCRQPSAIFDEKAFALAHQKSFSKDVSFPVNTSVLDEMMNAGSLKDLKNKALKRKILNWKTSLIGIREQELEVKVFSNGAESKTIDEGAFRTLFTNNGGDKKHQFSQARELSSNADMIQVLGFENYTLLFFVSSENLQSNYYFPAQKVMQDMIQSIDQELL